jgi:hypothetical protein
MFEKWRIKEHMEVTDATGRHVGTVDSVDNDRIKLTKSDAGDAAHHYLDIDMVERIEDDRIYLKTGMQLPDAQTRGLAGGGAGAQTGAGDGSAEFVSGGPSPTQGPQGTDTSLFGTSGHGTGMGGSGPN